MSEEVRLPPAQPSTGPVAERCCVCGKYAIAGYAPSKSSETRWWCWEHYPHKTLGKPNVT
jgi:hypothetical protein